MISINSQSNTQVDTPSYFKRNSKFILLLVIQLITIVIAFFFVYKYYEEKKKVADPTNIQTEQTNEIKNAVGKLILLNDGTEPTIATIKDINTLKKDNAEFYKNAKDGDILLVYSKRAILYSKTQNLILNVAPIVTAPTPTDVTPTPTQQLTNTPTSTPSPKQTITPTIKATVPVKR